MQKNNNHNNYSSSDIGFAGVLTLIFIVLKLVGVIDWSWWWVLSPTLIELGIVILVAIGFGIYVAYLKMKGEW